MDPFIYNSTTAHRDFPLYAQRFELFLKIQRIGFMVVTADDSANPVIVGEDTIKALNYLLLSGDPKILEIFNNSPQLPVLNYVSFKAILITRFNVKNPGIADYNFRSCKQLPIESLSDFATRLRTLAVSANIPAAAINQQILSVIRSTTDDHDTIMKCLDDHMTLENLIIWRQQFKIEISTVRIQIMETDQYLQVKSIDRTKVIPSRLETAHKAIKDQPLNRIGN